MPPILGRLTIPSLRAWAMQHGSSQGAFQEAASSEPGPGAYNGHVKNLTLGGASGQVSTQRTVHLLRIGVSAGRLSANCAGC